MSAPNGPSCTCTSRAVISERTHDSECHRRLWIEAEDRADAAELDAENCTKLLMVALGERNAALAEGERLREALRARDDTLVMVIGLPGFQRQHPDFAEGIRRLIAPPSPAVVREEAA
jgi:hypothetical protein